MAKKVVQKTENKKIVSWRQIYNDPKEYKKLIKNAKYN
jgi:hypothetical protein